MTEALATFDSGLAANPYVRILKRGGGRIALTPLEKQELGGLVQKAGLVELVDDDRATLLGAFLDLADQLRGTDDTGDEPHHLATRWRRRGLRAFDADHAAAEKERRTPPTEAEAPR